eukprot:6217269-Ditylum_brightwellii.AAC.1
MIPRDPNFVADSDSSLLAAGGFSTQLQFWWHLEWPEEVQARNIKKMKRDKDGNLISINILEFSTVILNYVACIVSTQDLRNR